MIYSAILIGSAFLLLAFAVERLSSSLGLPAVLILVLLGLLAKPLLVHFNVSLEGLDAAVSIIGAIGLVLIVLEGALDIKLRRDRLKLGVTAFAMASTGFVLCALILAGVAVLVFKFDPIQAAIMAVPFAVISSAVAIPSSQFLPEDGREFVVYESSISDILGVLVFFALVNSGGTLRGLWLGLFGAGMLSLLLAIICSVGLALMLMRVEGHVRFVPLLAGLFGLYAAGKLLHLSPLVMVLFFGLLLNNARLITRIPALRHWIGGDYDATLNEFKVLVLELTFAVRGFFFILLGYWTNLADLADPYAWLSAALVLVVIYGTRGLLLRTTRLDSAAALQWLAPRGLITILLFLAARDVLELADYINGTVLIVVLTTTALVMVGRLRHDQISRTLPVGSTSAQTGGRAGSSPP